MIRLPYPNYKYRQVAGKYTNRQTVKQHPGCLHVLIGVLEGKQNSKNFQENDCLRYLKVAHFSSVLRSTRERSGKFESRKKSCS